MDESEETKRYRALAEKARRSAAQAFDERVQAAFVEIAGQYDALADNLERARRRERERTEAGEIRVQVTPGEAHGPTPRPN